MPRKKKQEKVEFKTEAERLAHIRKTMQELNKNYGLDVLHFGEAEKEWKRAKFGIKELDEMLGNGIPHGTFSCIWGGAGVGKTSLGYYLTAQAQKEGKIVYYIALEPFDRNRAMKFGVDLNSIIIGQFPKAEQALDSIIEFARKKLVDIIIIDSLHSLAPSGIQETKTGSIKSIESDTMALLARKLSQFFKIAIDPIKRANIATLLIGQARMGLGSFIVIEKLSGGRALKHYSRIIVRMRKGSKSDAPTEKRKVLILDDEGFEKKKTINEIIGFDCVFELQKTQITGTQPELTKLHLPYFFSSGFNKLKEKEDDKEMKEEIKEIIKEPIKKKRGRPKKGELK